MSRTPGERGGPDVPQLGDVVVVVPSNCGSESPTGEGRWHQIKKVYQRKGYEPALLPFIPGVEVAGVVEALLRTSRRSRVHTRNAMLGAHDHGRSAT